MKRQLFFALLFLLCCQCTRAQHNAMALKANAFLDLLDETQLAMARYAFEDDERYDWHFVPRKRNGISFNDLNEKQRQAALELLKVSVSEQGFQKASNI